MLPVPGGPISLFCFSRGNQYLQARVVDGVAVIIAVPLGFRRRVQIKALIQENPEGNHGSNPENNLITRGVNKEVPS